MQDHVSGLIAHFPHIIQFELTRYGVTAGAVFAFTALFWRRLRKIRPAARPGLSQVRREVLASVRTTVIFALSGALSIAGGRIGLQQNYADSAALGWGWFWASILVLIVLHDAWFYWTHRLLHDPRLFRRWHGLHHKSRNPTPFAAYSFDGAEAAVNALFLPVALLVVPVAELAIFIFLLHMIVRNAVGHCGYELYPARRDGRPLFDFLTTVTHHDLHHAEAGWNYGLYFTFWDRLMGTEHPQYRERFAAAVGIPLDGSAVMALRSFKSADGRGSSSPAGRGKRRAAPMGALSLSARSEIVARAPIVG